MPHSILDGYILDSDPGFSEQDLYLIKTLGLSLTYNNKISVQDFLTIVKDPKRKNEFIRRLKLLEFI